MKVIHSVKNISVQECQHSLESRLIQVMKKKNADDSIRTKREFDSNVIDESDLQ
jgi:hypothetical protein